MTGQTPHQLCFQSARDLSALLRARKISAIELAEIFLSAIAKSNGPLNAVVTMDAEFTLAEAAKAQKRIHAGDVFGMPLVGVPFLAKDLDVTAGLRTTFGSLNNRDYVPRWDMFHIARLKESGCVLLGKTNTPEDGTIPNTYNDVFGPTRNPWNLERCAGGSSGGSASAVAAGLTPLATGSDGAGSIRLPASFNGVFGIKPTFGLIPFGPKGIGVMNTIGHLGPMTRSSADAAAMLDAMVGGDERDRASLPAPHGFLAALDEPFEMGRVAYSADLGYAPVKDEVRELFFSAIEKLRKAGWPLEEARPALDAPEKGSQRAIEVLVAVEWGTIPMKLESQNPEAYARQTKEVRQLAEFRKTLTLEDLWKAYEVRKGFCIAMGRFFEDYDLLLTPTLTRSAFELDRPWPMKGNSPLEEDRDLNSLLFPFNLTGDPACSLPIGLTKDGLPVGVQIVGPRHQDALVLRAARACEESCDFIARRPPFSVSA